MNYEQYPLLNSFSQCDDGSWHAEDIKSAIRKSGITLRGLCERYDLPYGSVSKAISQPLKKGELAITDYLGVPVQLLFPTRWTVDGQRVRPRYADKYTTVAEYLSC
ncbi:MAG: hypothetical protein CR991_11760 [Proteobacteria bacterium]|nr:MAG: hypothetical protein CR991_11760 [Pseudomonadota bacterium]